VVADGLDSVLGGRSPLSVAGQQLLSDKQEKQLKKDLKVLWMAKTPDGGWKYTGKQIAKALGFGAKEIPDNPYANIPPVQIYNYRMKFELPKRRAYRGYPHRYKHGKQEEEIDLLEIMRRVEAVESFTFHGKRKRAAYIFIFWGGLRNTENRNATPSDCVIDADQVIVDMFRLKKGSNVSVDEATYPIELRRKWWGVEELVQWIYRVEDEKGSNAKLFAVSRKTLWTWVKELFPKGYPHQLRLSRITYFCSDPDFSIAQIRSWTGLHLITIDKYIAKSGRYVTEAADLMTEKMDEDVRKAVERRKRGR